MQITVTIPDEVAVQAQVRSLTPQSYVEKLIAEQVATPRAQRSSAAALADLERFFDGMAAHSDKVPLLSDDAFTRESFYRDHD